MLTPRERQSLALVELEGLGARRAEELQSHGIESVGDLARLDERQLSAIIGEADMRRVRVCLRAARAAVLP
jgi:predicted RecB family nuclease